MLDNAPPSPADEEFWNDLLSHLDAGDVIPIIGPEAITFGADDRPLYPWLAAELGRRLDVALPQGRAPTNIQEVVDALRASNGDLDRVYLKLYQILKDPAIQPGPRLRRLVALTPFKLFLTTAFDPLLRRAIDEVYPLAPSDAHRAERRERHITENGGAQDLPSAYHELTEPCVYYLLGRVSPQQDFVVWDDDTLQYLLLLDRLLPGLTRLSAALKDKHLLVIGVSLTDWLLRFFVQVVKQQRLSKLAANYLYYSEQLPPERCSEVVIYFSRLTKRFRVFSVRPDEFITTLVEKCEQAFPAPKKLPGWEVGEPGADAGKSPRGAIFISYATPDLEAARSVYHQLTMAGCIVWFDRTRITAGERWINSLQQAIKDCGVFISLISKNTEKRVDAYYISERNWAFTRSASIAEKENFYVPVRIDAGVLIPDNEPVRVKELQGVSMPGAVLSPALVQLLRQQQRRYFIAQELPVPPGLADG